MKDASELSEYHIMSYCDLLDNPKVLAFLECPNNRKFKLYFVKHFRFVLHSDETILLCPPLVYSCQSCVKDPDRFPDEALRVLIS